MSRPGHTSPVRRIVANLPVADPETDRPFWTELLGLDTPMSQGWVVNHTATGSAAPAQVQLLTHDATAPEAPAVSVGVEGEALDEVHDRMVAAGLEIVHPLTVEPWGVRRFLVRTPGGVVVNVLRHVDP